MPWRLAQYASLGFAATMQAKGERWLPASVVVYLDPKSYRRDPGRLELEGELGFSFRVRYKVIKLWELPREPVLAMGSPGLCPLVPLMAGKPEDGLLQSTHKIVESRVPAETKRELLALTAGLAGVVVRDRGLLNRLLTETRLMGENYVFDVLRREGEAVGLVKGKAEGRAEGRAEGIRLSLLRVLRRRFGAVPASIRSAVERARDAGRLERLLDAAAVAGNLKEFERSLSARSR
jgi:hypothetical protein